MTREKERRVNEIPPEQIENPAVLHVVWAMDEGGAPVYHLTREQRRRGIDANILVASTGGYYASLAREAGAHVHELHQTGALDIRVARRAEKLFALYPIVHFHSTEPMLVALAARTGSRLFYTHRAGQHPYRLRKRIRHQLIGHYLRDRFDGIAANTRQSANAAATVYRIKRESVRVIYNGLDYTLLEPRRSREEVLSDLNDANGDVIRIGTAAILRRLKRVDRLIRAVASMQDERVHCYVFGEGPALRELQELANLLGIAERVTFAGHKRAIGDYLQVLDVFTLPSGPEEAFGNAVVEAMALGVPSVVFSDGGGLTEHIENGSTGVIANSQDEFVAALLRLARDMTWRRQLGGAGRESVRRKYATETMVTGYLALYSESSQLRGA